MADAYKIITTVKSTLERPGDEKSHELPSARVGRPMSLKWVVIVWCVLAVVGTVGFIDHFFGGIF